MPERLGFDGPRVLATNEKTVMTHENLDATRRGLIDAARKNATVGCPDAPLRFEQLQAW
jgi:hypothetical protein